jgi:CRISPR-associated endoribonuclease Cas6
MPRPIFATIELHLKFDAETIPFVSGQALHGLAFKYIAVADSKLADRIHNRENKPFTISRLKPIRNTPGEAYWKWTVLNEDLYLALSKMFYREWIDASKRELDTNPFVIADCIMDGGGRSILWQTEDIKNRIESVRSLTVRLHSPTAFKSGGNRVSLFPQPKLVWGGLGKRIKSIDRDLMFCPDVLDRLEEINVSEYRLSTRQLDFGDFVMKGVVGYITFVLPSSWNKEMARQMSALALVAPFTGIGTKTTHGMGQCSTKWSVEK